MPRRWYVVQSKPNYENVVAFELQCQRMRCFLPRMKLVRRIRGADVVVPSVLFPSYLFVRFDVTKTQWRSINGTRGVVKLLASTEDTVVPVPKGFVEALIAKTDRKGFIVAEQAVAVVKKFIVGDEIRVTEGIFQGFTGTCTRVKKDSLVVLMHLLSGKIGVELPTSTVDFV